MGLQYSFTLLFASTATYRAPGDWLVRQSRVHLAHYRCDRLLDGRDGDGEQVEHLPFCDQEKQTLRKVALALDEIVRRAGLSHAIPEASLARRACQCRWSCKQAPATKSRCRKHLVALSCPRRRRDKYCRRRRRHVVFNYSGPLCRTAQLHQDGHCRCRSYWRSLPDVLLPSTRLSTFQVREL